jgi:predicted transcriptional regulator of viral defense system
MDIQTAKQIFDAHNGIMKSKEIIENKIYNRFLKKLIDEGYVEKIKFGYYQWQDERAFSEATVIARLFPDAVICMESALQYYGYTDRTPSAWCLAVDKHSTKSRFNIDYPSVKPHYIPEEQMALGVEMVNIEDTELKIFNRERVICDCLRQENKMDVEVFNKAIQAYIKDPKKNVPRLMEYAKILRAENKVRKIIGVWI